LWSSSSRLHLHQCCANTVAPSWGKCLIFVGRTGGAGKSVGPQYADQPMREGEQRSPRPVRGVELCVDVLHMVAGRLRGYVKLGRDPDGRVAARDQTEDIDLTIRQAGGPRTASRPAVPGCGEDGLDRRAVQPTSLDILPEDRCRLLGSVHTATRRGFAQRLIRIGGGKDSFR
jgi:hypothetical protein